MAKIGLLVAAMLMSTQLFALETSGQVKKVVTDDEGMKIIFDSSLESAKPNAVFYLKNTNPQYDQLAGLIKNSIATKQSLTLQFQKDQIQLIENVKASK
ncbi:MAG: hypothetical protein ACXVAX_06410 [Pseudobdellovibrio sp.]